jgi:hypothetical protein
MHYPHLYGTFCIIPNSTGNFLHSDGAISNSTGSFLHVCASWVRFHSDERSPPREAESDLTMAAPFLMDSYQHSTYTIQRIARDEAASLAARHESLRFD